MRKNGGFEAKWPTSCQSQEVGPRDFFCVLVESICTPNVVCLRQSERNGYLCGVAMATGKVKWKVFLIIINVTGRKMKPKQTKSRSDEYFRRSTQMKNAKMAASGQNG